MAQEEYLSSCRLDVYSDGPRWKSMGAGDLMLRTHCVRVSQLSREPRSRRMEMILEPPFKVEDGLSG